MKKRQNLKKKASALLLAVAMIVTAFPQLSTTVYASELPDATQFATKEELKAFNTNNEDGDEKSAKVYFGNENQQWWIAGSQSTDSMVLFAASPLEREIQFNRYDGVRIYEGEYVYSSHYGASDIRNTLKSLETSYFTTSEQCLMNDTKIYTNDAKNGKIYQTVDKLYLAYGDYGDRYITVGTNQVGELNSGLRIDEKYWGNRDTFWLRAPDILYDGVVYVAEAGFYVSHARVVYINGVLMPAFELNLSSVIFASAAPAASFDGKLSTSGAFTLRHQSQADIGTATISQSEQSAVVTDVTNEDTYLVVQNKEGAWSKKVSSNDFVFAREMDSSLTSFENCKVWLETTSENITYAEEAAQGNGHNVKVNVGENLTVSSGNNVQTDITNTISDITIKVNDGYYLSEEYIDGIQGLKGLNGLTVTATDTGFTIYGTPTADVDITLPAATAMSKAPTPTLTVDNIARTKDSLTVNGTFETATYGDIEYQLDNETWGTNATLSGLQADSSHTVSIRYKGKGIYLPSEIVTVTVSTKKDGDDAISEPTNLTGVYGQTLKDVILPTGWTWVNKDTELSVGAKSYKARFDTTNYETDYDFNGVSGYNAQGHYVERTLSVEVSKADTSIEIKTDTMMDKAYDGQAMEEPEITVTGSSKTATFKWYQKGTDGNYKELTTAPVNAGSYKVKASVEADANYDGNSAELEFSITKAKPIYDIPQGLMMKQGDALSTVKLPEGFAWADDTQVLDELGEHTLKAVFTPEDTDNYQSVEVDITVKVVPPMTPLNSVPTIQAKDKTVTVGNKFDPLKGMSASDKEDGDLTKDIKVIENTVNMKKAGTYKVVYQVKDSKKATATKTITVTVKEKAGSQGIGNKPGKGNPAQAGVETGDTANIFLWGMTAVVSALGILVIIGKRRKIRRN